MDEHQQAVQGASWLADSWQWLVGLALTLVVIPYVKFSEKRAADTKERVRVIEERVCDSDETRDILKEGIDPLQTSMSTMIQRVGQISDTMTQIAMHVGPNGPKNRRSND